MLKICPKNKRVTICNPTMQAFLDRENPKCMNPRPPGKYWGWGEIQSLL